MITITCDCGCFIKVSEHPDDSALYADVLVSLGWSKSWLTHIINCPKCNGVDAESLKDLTRGKLIQVLSEVENSGKGGGR